MKHHLIATFGALCASLSPIFAFSLEPTGNLYATPSVIQTGSHPKLSWNINHPLDIRDSVILENNATITTKETLDMEIRVIGTGVTHKSSQTGQIIYDPTEVYLKVGSTSFAKFFFDSNPNVDPSRVVVSRRVQPNTQLNFQGRYYIAEARQWGSMYSSTTNTPNIKALFHGDLPPSKMGAQGAPSLEQFIKPYLDSQGKVKIGPMDMIVFMELTHSPSQITAAGYDMQDFVMLITFKKVPLAP